MKRLFILAFAVLIVGAISAAAQTPSQAPQGQQKATAQSRAGTGAGPNFVDANGDGICDNFQSGTRPARAGGARRGGGYGPGDGTGNRGIGPRDGTGFGPGAGSGLCDGTGPKGFGRGRGPRR